MVLLTPFSSPKNPTSTIVAAVRQQTLEMLKKGDDLRYIPALAFPGPSIAVSGDFVPGPSNAAAVIRRRELKTNGSGIRMGARNCVLFAQLV